MNLLPQGLHAVAIGSNQEAPRNILSALNFLIAQADIVELSAFYASADSSNRRPDAARFLNGVVLLKSPKTPLEFQATVLRRGEVLLKRERPKDAITIDLDHLALKSLTSWRDQPFVVVPLSELFPPAGGWITENMAEALTWDRPFSMRAWQACRRR